MDHALVATADRETEDAESFSVFLNRNGRSAKMTLHRVIVEEADDGVCRNPLNHLTPIMDGSQVYGTVPDYLKVRCNMSPMGS